MCARRENLCPVRECPAGTGQAATLARIPGDRAARQGELVLPAAPGWHGGQPGASSRPPEHAAATCQAVTRPRTPNAPKRSVTAAVAAPNAASTSSHGEPSALGTPRSTPARRATRNRCSRTASSRVPSCHPQHAGQRARRGRSTPAIPRTPRRRAHPTDATRPGNPGNRPAQPPTATRPEPDQPLPSSTGASAHPARSSRSGSSTT
jgi:hypothetical protein